MSRCVEAQGAAATEWGSRWRSCLDPLPFNIWSGLLFVFRWSNNFFQGQCLKSFGFGRFDLGCVGIRSFHPLRRFRKCELFLSLISEVLLSHAAH